MGKRRYMTQNGAELVTQVIVGVGSLDPFMVTFRLQVSGRILILYRVQVTRRVIIRNIIYKIIATHGTLSMDGGGLGSLRRKPFLLGPQVDVMNGKEAYDELVHWKTADSGLICTAAFAA